MRRKGFAVILLATLVVAACAMDRSAAQPIGDAAVSGVAKALNGIPGPDGKMVPAPLLVDPPMVTFGMVEVAKSATRRISLSNRTAKPVVISAVVATGRFFRVDAGQLPVTLAPNEKVEVSIFLEPAALGRCEGTLAITLTEPAVKQIVELSGRAVAK